MSTTSGPLSPFPSVSWPSLPLPTITFPGTVFPSTSDSSVAVTSTRTTTPAPTSTTRTTTGIPHPTGSTSLTQSLSTSTTVMSSETISTLSSVSSTGTPVSTSSSTTITLQSSSFTRSEVSSANQTASSTPLVGTLAPAPSDDSGATGGSGPTVASAEGEISHLKETRNIVIAVLFALALVAVLVAVRAVYLRRRSTPQPSPLPQQKCSGPLLTADTPVGGASHGAPWPFVTTSEWQPPQLNRLSPPPLPQYAQRNPRNRASILPQTVDAWISGAGSSSVDLHLQHTPLPSPGDRHAYKPGYI